MSTRRAPSTEGTLKGDFLKNSRLAWQHCERSVDEFRNFLEAAKQPDSQSEVTEDICLEFEELVQRMETAAEGSEPIAYPQCLSKSQDFDTIANGLRRLYRLQLRGLFVRADREQVSSAAGSQSKNREEELINLSDTGPSEVISIVDPTKQKSTSCLDELTAAMLDQDDGSDEDDGESWGDFQEAGPSETTL